MSNLTDEYAHYNGWQAPESVEHLREDGCLVAHSGRWEIVPGLVDPDAAIEAGLIAKEIIKYADKLPYANKEEERDRSFTRVGIFDPEEYSPERTIFGYDRSYYWANPLLEVVGEMQVIWPRLRFANYLYLDCYSPRADLPRHQDFYHEDVAIMELLHGSFVTLNDRKGDVDIRRYQRPGDSYLMHLTENRKWSPWHMATFPWARLSLRMYTKSPLHLAKVLATKEE